MAVLLEVKNLKTQFQTDSGLVKAVDDVSYRIDENEIVELERFYFNCLKKYDVAFRRDYEDIIHIISYPKKTAFVLVKKRDEMVGFSVLGLMKEKNKKELLRFQVMSKLFEAASWPALVEYIKEQRDIKYAEFIAPDGMSAEDMAFYRASMSNYEGIINLPEFVTSQVETLTQAIADLEARIKLMINQGGEDG